MAVALQGAARSYNEQTPNGSPASALPAGWSGSAVPDQTMELRPSPRPKCRSLMGVRMAGTGSYVPDAVVTNDHLHGTLGHDSEWIVKRTGILERRHALPHQATSDLGRSRPESHDLAGVQPRHGLLVLATFTPDMSFPSTACLLQDRLGIVAPAIEVEAACAGFMYALITGAAYVLSGVSDTGPGRRGRLQLAHPQPRRHQDLSALRRRRRGGALDRGSPEQGLVSRQPRRRRLRRRPAQPAGRRQPHEADARSVLAKGLHYMYMDGRAVFRWAVDILSDTIQDVLKAAGLRPTTSTCTSRTRRTSASSTPPATCCASRAARSTTTSTATATPRPARSRWRWTRRWPRAV